MKMGQSGTRLGDFLYKSAPLWLRVQTFFPFPPKLEDCISLSGAETGKMRYQDMSPDQSGEEQAEESRAELSF